VTPIFTSACTDSSQRTLPVTCFVSRLRVCDESWYGSAVTFATTGTFMAPTCTFSSSTASLSADGAISAEWNGADTGRAFTSLAPLSLASFIARSTAPLWPAITTCPAPLKFAGWQASVASGEASRQVASTSSCSRPMIAAIAPCPSGTASCMNVPRRCTSRTASANDSAPA